MRLIPAATAASVLALGLLLGGFTASTDAITPGTDQQRTVATDPSPNVPVPGQTDNNGNG
ncbi:hypothetical protein ACN27F_25155 [Solwaraspora sp. WMMB335]|uniref:hypothetical protein n=1 Tax=Solwaraspora sp. WMMB335 TaxID=3404118 RepID=UPI003B94F938